MKQQRNNLIPDRLIFVWTGRSFPYFCRLAVESALLSDRQVQVEIHHFGESPADAEHFRALRDYRRVSIYRVDLEEIFSGLESSPGRYVELLRQIPLHAHSAKSNLVRYGILHARGGVYLDFDVIVLRSVRHLLSHPAFIGEELVWRADEARVHGRLTWWMIKPTMAYLWCYGARRLDARWLGGRRRLERVARLMDPLWQTTNLNNAVLGSMPGGSFVRRVLAAALERDPRIRYGLGPTLVSGVAREDRSDVAVLPPRVFYGEPPSYSFRYFEEPELTPDPSAVLIHYVSSNHRAVLRELDRQRMSARRHRGLFYALGTRVADAAVELPTTAASAEELR